MNLADAHKHALWAAGAIHEGNIDDARKYLKWANDEVKE